MPDLRVLRDVGRERVDRAPVVDAEDEERKLLIGGRVERLGEAAVLAPALAAEDDGEAVVVAPVRLGHGEPQVPVEEDGPCGSAAYGNCSATSAHPPWKCVFLSKMCMDPRVPRHVPPSLAKSSAMIFSAGTPEAKAWQCSR